MNREFVINKIEKAFSCVGLGNGIGIYEAEAIDNYADKKAINEARAKDRLNWDNWNDIPNKVIEVFYSALCFVDAEGMRFLLPAYMKFALNNFDKSDSASIDSVIYALDRGLGGFEMKEEILSNEQKKAIIVFLKFMVIEVGDELVDAEVASRAYENCWSEYDN